MREGLDRLSKTKDPVEQKRLDQEFLERAKRRDKKSAERYFNRRIKKEIKLNDPYTKEQIEFRLEMNWDKLEPMLKERFNFRVEGESYIFTEIKK